MSKIPVVYILSNGRSGTTLLDLLLGAHPNIWTLGEAHYLPWELVNPITPCGDGLHVRDSAFWRPLLGEFPTETAGYHIGYFLNRQHLGKVLRWNLIPDLIRGSVSERWQDAVHEYGERNSRFFRVAHEAAEEQSANDIRWLVDASKDPYRLFWLQHSGHFDLRVIHLIKDPRAFVYSMVRGQQKVLFRKVVRFAGRWVIENALMRRLCQSSFEPHQIWRQHYEELARDPGNVLSSIGTWLGVNYSADLVRTFRDYENFAVSGNAMRLRQSDTEIRLDERWKSSLPDGYAQAIRAIAQPFASYCGYPAFASSV